MNNTPTPIAQAARLPDAYMVRFGVGQTQRQLYLPERRQFAEAFAGEHPDARMSPLWEHRVDLRAVYDWAIDPNRKAALYAFPAGTPEQEVAMLVSMVLERKLIDEAST